MNPPASDARLLYLLGVAFCCLWSSAFVAAKMGLAAAPPFTFLVIRFAFGGLLMVAMLYAMGRRWPASRADIGTGILLGVLNNGAYLGLFYVAMQWISAGMAALIAAMTPLATVFLAHWLLGERATLRSLAGVALGLGGVFIVVNSRLGGGMEDPLGLVLAFLGMLCLTAGTILYRKRGAHADPFALNTVQTLAGGAAVLPFALLLEDWQAVEPTATLFLSIAYLVVMVSLGALLIWFWMIRLAGAGRASAFHFLNPGLGLLFAFLILGEPVSAVDLMGLGPIVVGILLVTWPAAQRPDRA